MTLVAIAEARENLPELLRRAAAGEQIVITEGEKWLAALTTPPSALSPLTWARSAEEEAARQVRAESLVREWLKLRKDAPVPIPEGMSYETYIEQYQEQE